MYNWSSWGHENSGDCVPVVISLSACHHPRFQTPYYYYFLSGPCSINVFEKLLPKNKRKEKLLSNFCD